MKYVMMAAIMAGTAIGAGANEVAPGVYVESLGTHGPWQVMQVETKKGVSCYAYRIDDFGETGPEPYQNISSIGLLSQKVGHVVKQDFTGGFNLEVLGKSRVVELEWRHQGERFFQDGELFGIPAAELNDGDLIDISAHMWEYPNLRSGYIDASSEAFDVGPLSTVVSAIETCG